MWYVLETFELCDKTLQFKLYEIEWKACQPVDFWKVWDDKAHAKFTLADKMQATMGIMTILCKQYVKLLVKGLMRSVVFLSVQDALYFIVPGSLRHRIRQWIWETANVLDELSDGCESRYFAYKKLIESRGKN